MLSFGNSPMLLSVALAHFFPSLCSILLYWLYHYVCVCVHYCIGLLDCFLLGLLQTVLLRKFMYVCFVAHAHTVLLQLYPGVKLLFMG